MPNVDFCGVRTEHLQAWRFNGQDTASKGRNSSLTWKVWLLRELQWLDYREGPNMKGDGMSVV